MIKKTVLIILFVLGLVYLFLPGPTLIDQFAPLPNSEKSIFSGDTTQNPNIAAYFSDFNRDYITAFYKNQLIKNVSFGFLIPPIRINHRPEEAYQYIRDQQESTFLEEYVYPLRESFFVNGYEPAVANMIAGHFNPTDYVGNSVIYREKLYKSKTTIRLYFAKPQYRLIVYLGIWFSILGLYFVGKKILREND